MARADGTDGRAAGRGGGAGRGRPVEAMAGRAYAELGQAARRGVLGLGDRRPQEKALAAEIVAASPSRCRDLTGSDLRNAILALAAADVAISNDSGLLHVAAAIGTPSIGIFGPTSPWHWAPLNPLAAVIEPKTDVPCRPCHKPTCRFGHHRCMRDIGTDEVFAATRRALATAATVG